MQAIAIRSELSAALALASKIVNRRNTIPILSNVAMFERGGALVVQGTDLDREMTIRLDGSPADSGFAVTVPAHTIRDVEKKAPDASEVSISERRDTDGALSRAAFGFGDLEIESLALDLTDWPTMEIEGIGADFTLSRADMLAMLDKVEFAISTEETRYYLNGIYMHVTEEEGANRLRFIATDGHRMAWHEYPAPEGCTPEMHGVIIPAVTVKTLRDLCKTKGLGDTFRVEVNTVKVRFTIGNVTLVSKLIDGTFPDYSRVIPRRNDKRATFDRAALVKAIKAVTCISSERGRAVKLELAQGEPCTLSVHNPDAGTARFPVECEFSGAPLEIGFNARYALDILEADDADTVTAALACAGSPILIESAKGGFVLMPMRV